MHGMEHTQETALGSHAHLVFLARPAAMWPDSASLTFQAAAEN